MSYIDGFLVPVPIGNKQVYRDMAAKFALIFREYGAVRTTEYWGDDLPDGKVTDVRMAVKAGPGENVVMSWVVWPSKAVRDAAHAKFEQDPRMNMGDDMPFDGKRMIFGGFSLLLDTE